MDLVSNLTSSAMRFLAFLLRYRPSVCASPNDPVFSLNYCNVDRNLRGVYARPRPGLRILIGKRSQRASCCQSCLLRFVAGVVY